MKNIFLSFVAGLTGGVIGAYFLLQSHSGRIPAAISPNVVTASELRIIDGNKKLRAQLGVNGASGVGLWLYDTEGRNRTMLGIYPPNEGELPVLVLNDKQGHAAGLFRLVNKDMPYLILKNNGSDKSIFGISDSAEPFLVNYGKETKEIFGKR